jgi:transcriptional regulator with XRE-family HTH domain
MSGEHERELSALGQAIRLTRVERSMSPAQLAAAASIYRRRLDAIEEGRFDPAYDVLIALAAGLGVELAALVTRAEFIAGQDTHHPSRTPSPRNRAFGRRLRKLREERGFSREVLGARTGLHRTGIEKVEKDTRDPRLATILALARGLGVKPGELVEGLDDSEG